MMSAACSTAGLYCNGPHDVPLRRDATASLRVATWSATAAGASTMPADTIVTITITDPIDGPRRRSIESTMPSLSGASDRLNTYLPSLSACNDDAADVGRHACVSRRSLNDWSWGAQEWLAYL